MKAIEKRRRVMQRSMRLGHCICNPKKSCPCDVFHQQDVCPCAGERGRRRPGQVRLTELVEAAGCASKIDQATLQRCSPGCRFRRPARLGRDAGRRRRRRLPARRADGPGANGRRLLAVGRRSLPLRPDCRRQFLERRVRDGRPADYGPSIVGFPAGKLPDDVLRQILRGGIDKMAEAGVAVIGGHSINDNEIKAGFAVTGLVHPHRITTNAAARPGDRLVLTKPLGTGILAFAAQIGRRRAGGTAAAARSMAALNRRAAELMLEFDAHACTDVTGFGLMGHLESMAAASNVDVEIVWDDLPLLPGVLECVAEGILPGRGRAEPRIVRPRPGGGRRRRAGGDRHSLRRRKPPADC